MKRILLSLLAVFLISPLCYSQVTIAKWTFEGITVSSAASSVPDITEGDNVANEGIKATGSTFTGYHLNSSTVWSTPAGTGAGSTAKSISSTHWAEGDYFEFVTSTSGYADISLSFNSYSSNTGPRDFKVQYKVNSDAWTDVPSSVANSTYQNGTSWTSSVKSLDLSSITGLNAKEVVMFRLVCVGTVSANGNTIATGGTSRVDNVTVSAGTTLPVTTVNFTAKPINKSILLSWQTLSEKENKHFEIERSADGEIFSSLTTIAGAGTSAEVNNYSYTDYSPLAGVNYYRLLQQDINGTTTIVKTIAVNSQLNVNQLSVYATTSGVNIDLNAEKAGEATVAVYNFSGTKIAESSLLLEAGLNTVALEADLLPGLYFVKVLANNEVSTVKFAK